MELFMDLFSKVQNGIAFLAAGLLLVHWLRPKAIRFRNAVKATVVAARKSVIDVTVSAGPSIAPRRPVAR